MGQHISLPRRGVIIHRRRYTPYTANGSVLVGLAGQKGVGKDAFADALEMAFYDFHSHPMRHAFADGVKDLMCALFGITRQFIEHWKNIDTNPPRFNTTMRVAMQTIGEQMRTLQEDVWVNNLRNELRGDSIITDVRHENEISALHKWGGKIVLIVRGEPNDDTHVSEVSLKEATKWCNENIKPVKSTDTKEKASFVSMTSVQIPPDAPNIVNSIDFVVFNDSTLESLETVAKSLLESIAKEVSEYESDEVGSMNI
jgi:hypothetical protein